MFVNVASFLCPAVRCVHALLVSLQAPCDQQYCWFLFGLRGRRFCFVVVVSLGVRVLVTLLDVRLFWRSLTAAISAEMSGLGCWVTAAAVRMFARVSLWMLYIGLASSCCNTSCTMLAVLEVY